jgi:hypothetical protein
MKYGRNLLNTLEARCPAYPIAPIVMAVVKDPVATSAAEPKRDPVSTEATVRA